MTNPNQGAKIQALSLKPSLDLAQLIELLAEAVETMEKPIAQTPDALPGDPKARPLFWFDPQKQRLRICTSAVLLNLFDFRSFRGITKTDGEPSPWFVQDFEPPALGQRATLGGELKAGNLAQLPRNVDRLMEAINVALDHALPDPESWSRLLLDEPAQQMQRIAKAAGTGFQDQAMPVSSQSLRFDNTASGATESTIVAKVWTALERVAMDDCLHRLTVAVRTHLDNDGWDEDEIDDAIKCLEDEHRRVGSQLNRFLTFLGNEALARIRLKVTFQLMEAIANYARPSTQGDHGYLVAYIDRVMALAEALQESGFGVDLTKLYKTQGDFDLLEHWNRSTFFFCLPVWPEWKTQIFEERDEDGRVQRETCYRFRINGKNPESQKSAYEARLDLLEEKLVLPEEKAISHTVKKELSELLVLAVVVPPSADSGEPIAPDRLLQQMNTLVEQLRQGGMAAVQTLIQDLRDRKDVMNDIAKVLVAVLKTKGDRLLSETQRHASTQFICVKRGIMDWNRLGGAVPGMKDLLVGSQDQDFQEQATWFKHIEITNSPQAPQLLFSVEVKTQLAEHNLVFKKNVETGDREQQTLNIQRMYPGKLLQVIWLPHQATKNQPYQASGLALTQGMKSWTLPAAVQLEYETRTLGRSKQSNDQTRQLHTAAVSAFTILAYCCLWAIVKRLQELDGETDFTTLMLRLQDTGNKSKEQHEGDRYLYAAAQAIEAMLAQDVPVRMQGLVLDKLSQGQSSGFTKSGTFGAMLSAFPLVIQTPQPPAIAKIGLISYATRPSDEVPRLGQDQNNMLFLTQSYIASAVDQPFTGYRLQRDRTRTDIATTREELQKQRIVKEEIARLQREGCQHIILLSHGYGTRRINRTAAPNLALNPLTFLEEIAQTFPHLTIYPLLRDVFPATRLRKRSSGESFFEISQAGDHSSFLSNQRQNGKRDIIPIYTFATLHVVGNEDAQRPQSGFCSYFLVSDRRVSDINWMERARQHLINAEGQSSIHSALVTVLRGLHFLEGERFVKAQGMPVLDPFSWIAPTTKEAAGEVEIFHARRRGPTYLSYPALLTHVSRVLHRRMPHAPSL